MKYNIEEDNVVIEFGKTKINEMFKEHLIKFLESCLSVQVRLHRDFTEDDEIFKEDAVMQKTRKTAQTQDQNMNQSIDQNIVPKEALNDMAEQINEGNVPVNYSEIVEDDMEEDTLNPLDTTENQNMKEWVPETQQVETNNEEEIEDEFGDDL